jgi:hypothetical protein
VKVTLTVELPEFTKQELAQWKKEMAVWPGYVAKEILRNRADEQKDIINKTIQYEE